MTTDKDREKVSALRNWIARYKPDILKLTLRDGKTQEVRKPLSQRGQWAHLEAAVRALPVAYLECWKKGAKEPSASRSIDIEEEPEDQPAYPDINEETNPLAALVHALPTIAELLKDAQLAGAQAHKEAYELAFQKQLELVQILSMRLSSLERIYFQLMNERAERAAQGGDENDAMAMGLLDRWLASRGEGKTKPNGVSASASASPDEPLEIPKKDD